MALSGVHISCNYVTAGSVHRNGEYRLGRLIASETMAAPGVSTVTAPEDSNPSTGAAMFSISAAVPIFYAIGRKPNANVGPRRYYDPAGGREDVFVDKGDKFAWIAA